MMPARGTAPNLPPSGLPPIDPAAMLGAMVASMGPDEVTMLLGVLADAGHLECRMVTLEPGGLPRAVYAVSDG